MKIGIVGLHVKLPAGRKAPEGIKQDRNRPTFVRNAINAARADKCNLVLLPGWTIVSDRVPAWLRQLSAGLTIVFEYVPRRHDSKEAQKGSTRRTCVLRNNRLLVGPVEQLLIRGKDVPDSGPDLVTELRDPRLRRWKEKDRNALLMVCGEVNLVAGGGRSKARWNRSDLTQQHVRGGYLILNPAHTPGEPQAMRDKRQWLSGRKGVLVTTANIWTSPSGSKRKAARAWIDGKPASLVSVERDAMSKGYTLDTLVIP